MQRQMLLPGLAAFMSAFLCVSVAAEDARPATPVAYIISPADGAILSSPVTIRMGLRGMGIAPAGVEKAGTGHFHVLVDAQTPKAGELIPADDNYLHFGAGQIETELKLAPGLHTLQLVLGDANHLVFDPPVASGRITVEVR